MTLLEIKRFDTQFTIPDVSTAGGMDFNVSDIAVDNVHPNGGKEWEVIFTRKPRFTQVAVPFTSSNLRFLYQPPLTLEQQQQGDIRPDNVVGSYAVYHASKQGGEYKAGKMFHIYRPKLVDDSGKTAWADLLIQNNTLRITLPDAWLNTAKYPVTVDPTFGYESVGGSAKSMAYAGPETRVWGWKDSVTCDGTTDRISVVLYVGSGSHTADVKACLYKDSDNSLVGGGYSGSFSIDTNVVFHDCALADPVVNGTSYQISCCVDYTNSTTVVTRYDADATNSGALKTGDNYAAMFYDPITWTTKAYGEKYSIHCDYTCGGGGISIPVAMHHYNHHIAKAIRGG